MVEVLQKKLATFQEKHPRIISVSRNFGSYDQNHALRPCILFPEPVE